MARTNRFSFIVGSLFLAAVSISIVLGAFMLRSSGMLKQRMTINVLFDDVAGLRQGAPVRLSGLDIGTVDSVDVDASGTRHLVVLSIIDKPHYRQGIRTDSKFQVLSDNLLGNKLVEVSWGSSEATPLANGATVVGESPVSIAGILKDLRQTVRNTAGMSARIDKALQAMEGEDGSGLSRSMIQIQQSLADLSSVTGELKSLFEKDSRDPDSLRATLADLRKASGNAAELMAELKLSLRGEDGKPRKLGALLTNLEKTAANSQDVTDQVKLMLGGGKPGKPVDLAQTLKDLEVSANNLKDITESTKSMIASMRKMYPPNWFK